MRPFTFKVASLHSCVQFIRTRVWRPLNIICIDISFKKPQRKGIGETLPEYVMVVKMSFNYILVQIFIKWFDIKWSRPYCTTMRRHLNEVYDHGVMVEWHGFRVLLMEVHMKSLTSNTLPAALTGGFPSVISR